MNCYIISGMHIIRTWLLASLLIFVFDVNMLSQGKVFKTFFLTIHIRICQG